MILTTATTLGERWIRTATSYLYVKPPD